MADADAPSPERQHAALESPRVRWLYPGLGPWTARGAVGLFALALILTRVDAGVSRTEHPWLAETLTSFMVITLLLTPVLMVLSFVAPLISVPRARPATLSSGPEGLTLKSGKGRERRIPKGDLEDGVVVPLKPKARLNLRLRSGRVIAADVGDEAAAHGMLSALGLGVAQRRVTLDLFNPGEILVGSIVGALLGALANIPLLILLIWIFGETTVDRWLSVGTLPLVALAILYGGQAIRKTRSIVVGADGVRVPARRRSTRFIPYAKISGVEGVDGILTLHLKDEPRVARIAQGVASDSEVEAAVCRIRSAMAESAGRRLRPEALAALEPGGRSLPEWREELRALVQKGDAYRQSKLTLEDLLAVLADPGAPPRERIGAALALRVSEAPEAPAMIREAAGACARDRLRIALEQTARDELAEAALEEVLAEAEQEEAARAGARSPRVTRWMARIRRYRSPPSG
jgi:hypothetical protein